MTLSKNRQPLIYQYIIPLIYHLKYLKSTSASLNNNMQLVIAGLNKKHTNKLSDHIEVTVGMKAMIKVNVSTEGEVANGTRGMICSIILDPREEAVEPENDRTIKLTYPPALIMFEPDSGSQISSIFIDKRN